MQERPDLIVCEECDAVHRRTVLACNEIAFCQRCGAELEREFSVQLQRLLPLTATSLILFVIANSFPIVEIELQGLTSQTTLFGAVLALQRDGMLSVAFLVLMTTILFPLIQLLILFYMLLPSSLAAETATEIATDAPSEAATQNPPGQEYNTVRPGVRHLLHLMQFVRPWGMIEVFLLGVLVALVKLSNIANVLPGIALWAFGALTVVLTVVVSFNPRYLWSVLNRTHQTPKQGECIDGN